MVLLVLSPGSNGTALKPESVEVGLMLEQDQRLSLRGQV